MTDAEKNYAQIEKELELIATGGFLHDLGNDQPPVKSVSFGVFPDGGAVFEQGFVITAVLKFILKFNDAFFFIDQTLNLC